MYDFYVVAWRARAMLGASMLLEWCLGLESVEVVVGELDRESRNGSVSACVCGCLM